MKFKPSIFDPGKARLITIKNEVAKVQVDPKKATKEDYELVVDTRKKLVKVRTSLAKIGKSEREQALKYQRDVIAYERELTSVLAPEEARIKKLEDDIKLERLREVRKDAIKELLVKLKKLGDGVEITEEELLLMDTNTFDNYYAQRVAAWHDKQEEMKREQAFQDFLKSHDYNEDTDIVQGDTLYRKVATYDNK